MPQSRWETTPGAWRLVILLGGDQPITFFRVYRPPGTLEGCFWRGEKDHLIGFINVDPAAETQWGRIVVDALRASSMDGRGAFEFWSQEGNGYTWDAAPVGETEDLDALIDLVRLERAALSNGTAG
jgi:hypothetical protein